MPERTLPAAAGASPRQKPYSPGSSRPVDDSLHDTAQELKMVGASFFSCCQGGKRGGRPKPWRWAKLPSFFSTLLLSVCC